MGTILTHEPRATACEAAGNGRYPSSCGRGVDDASKRAISFTPFSLRDCRPEVVLRAGCVFAAVAREPGFHRAFAFGRQRHAEVAVGRCCPGCRRRGVTP